MSARPVIIPSEIQVREFDAKLLLACFLAERGVRVYVGARHEIHANMHEFPPSVYLAKDFRKPSNRIFKIMDHLGHKIVAWDEEGLLTFDPKIYYSRRVSQEAISRVQAFYAWGKPDKKLIENAPYFPGVPVYVTGNPRMDLLRPELQGFHAADVKRLKERFGDFILVNTNFGVINHTVRSQMTQPGKPDPNLGTMPTPELDDIWRHRIEMYEVFRRTLPRLAARFPDTTIVLRPHPTENRATWRKAALGCKNVEIIHEGSATPWLLAASIMIHNSCTTGLEAFLAGRPSIMYEPKEIRPGVSTLSNRLSHKIDTEQALFSLISDCLRTGQALPRTDAQWAAITKILAATKGDLASETISRRLLDLLAHDSAPDLPPRIIGQFQSRLRKLEKSLTGLWPGHKTGKAHNRERYPGLTLEEVESKLARLSSTLGRFDGLGVRRVKNQIFRIDPPPWKLKDSFQDHRPLEGGLC